MLGYKFILPYQYSSYNSLCMQKYAKYRYTCIEPNPWQTFIPANPPFSPGDSMQRLESIS